MNKLENENRTIQAKPLVIKLGGAILSEPHLLSNLFGTIAKVKEKKRAIVIVHGGGAQVDMLLERLSFKTERIAGLRVTPSEQIPYIVGALAGTATKTLQSYAKRYQLDALGLSLTDGNLCELVPTDKELGHVAMAKAGNPSLVHQLLRQGYLIIINSIGLDQSGELMNINADDAAVAVADALDGELVFLSDVPGVLDEKKELISELTFEEAQKLIERNIIHDGMRVKVNAAFDAVELLHHSVYIATWEQPEVLYNLFQGKPVGTQFLANQ